MPSFTETATLIVKDKSTAQINKINAALKKLFATARSLKGIKIDIKTPNLRKAIADVNKLQSALRGVKSKTVNVKVTGVSAARRQVQALANDIKKLSGANVRMRAATARAGRAESRQRLYGAALASSNLKKAQLARVKLIQKAERENATFTQRAQAAAQRQQARQQATAQRQQARQAAIIQSQAARQAALPAPPRGVRVPNVRAPAAQPWGYPAPRPTRPPAQPSAPAQSSSFARGIASDISQHIRSAIISGTAQAVKEGTTQADIGKTGLDLKELSKDRRKLVESQITELGAEQAARPGGSMWGRGQITQQVSEMLGVVKAGAATDEADFKTRAAQAKFMADRNLELAGSMVKMGVAQSQASEESIKYGKALEIQGKIYNKTTGVLDPAAAAKQYDLIHSLIPAIGKEMTGSNYLQLQKYLRAGRFGLSDEATALAMSSFEEMGTSAAVGINQMIKTVGGTAKKTALAEQARLGLIGTKDVVTGKVGKQKVKTIAGDLSEANAKLLRENPQQWVDTKLIPALKSDLIKKGAKPEEAAAKVTDPAYVATQISKLFSDRTAADMATSMVLRSQENQQFLKDWRSRTATMESQRAATSDSVLGVTAGLQNQLQGVFGQAIVAAAPILTPAMGYLSEGLRKVAETTAAAAQGDPAAAAKLAAGTLTAAALAPMIKAAASPAMALIQSAAGPLGTAAALSGAADPATRPLSLAALALQGAAADLSGAAKVQLAAAGKGILTPDGLPDAGGGKKGGWRSRVGRMAKGALLAGAAVGGTIMVVDAINTSEEDQSPGKLRQARQDLVNTKQEVSLMQEAMTAAKDQSAKDALYSKLSELNAKEEALTATIARREAIARGEKPPVVQVEPTSQFRRPVKWIPGLPDELRSLREIKVPQGEQPALNWPDEPMPAPSWLPDIKQQPAWLPELKAPLSRMDDVFKQLQDQTPQSRLDDAFRQVGAMKPSMLPPDVSATAAAPTPVVAAPSDTMMTAAAKIETSATTFSSVFDSGPQKLAEAGTTAGTNAATSFGGGAAGWGATMAAAFRAGVAGIQIGIGAIPGAAGAKPTNTGTQSE